MSQANQNQCANGYDTLTCSCLPPPPTPTPTPDDFEACTCCPVIVDVAGNGFSLTSSPGGVRFDLNTDGIAQKIAWTSSDSDDAFVVLDRGGNGLIDDGSEVFGNFTPQPEPPPGEEKNGFLALAEYDKFANGGNGDGIIDSRDTIFASLHLWQDTNHNGISEPSEVHTFSEFGLTSMDLGYKESRKTDIFGNQFKYRAKVKYAQLGRWAWDVYLVTSP